VVNSLEKVRKSSFFVFLTSVRVYSRCKSELYGSCVSIIDCTASVSLYAQCENHSDDTTQNHRKLGAP